MHAICICIVYRPYVLIQFELFESITYIGNIELPHFSYFSFYVCWSWRICEESYSIPSLHQHGLHSSVCGQFFIFLKPSSKCQLIYSYVIRRRSFSSEAEPATDLFASIVPNIVSNIVHDIKFLNWHRI